MRVIFLDIDGVLNSPDFQIHRFQRGPGRRPIDPVCVEHLNTLIRQTQARIVVSSTWRHEGLTRIRRTLRDHSVTAAVVGTTPILERRTTSGLYAVPDRGHEIQAWLDGTRFTVERFVILDDDADMAHLIGHLVRTDYRTGLTAADAERACALLAP